MTSLDRYSLLETLFQQLRQKGFNLGMDEYLAAIETVRQEYITTDEELHSVLQLLWCHSREERGQFQLLWHSLTLAESASIDSPPEREEVSDRNPSEIVPETPIIESSFPEEEPVPQKTPEFAPLPLRAPIQAIEPETRLELSSYFPIPRRNMVYSWRYLRHFIADGVRDALDVEATVNQAVRQGFYLAPVYRPRLVNHAHLLLLIDQEGSMTPFHRFSRELVETAQYESNIARVEVFYFHNFLADSVYCDSYLTEPIAFSSVLTECERDTSILIVSDAGAARGDRRLSRIQATAEFLFPLKQSYPLLAWLNPLPESRWRSTSAEIIAHLVPMFAMNTEGFQRAIEAIRP
jgi:uncharacterized protein